MSNQKVNDIFKLLAPESTAPLEALLKSSPSQINLSDCKLGWTPLYRAVICGYESQAKLLLSYGANPNHQTKLGETALHQAVDNSKLALVEILLSCSADPNIGENNGNGPLHYAVMKGNQEMAELLVRWGADPNKQNKLYEKSPLYIGVERRFAGIVKVLVEVGGSIDLKDSSGTMISEISTSSEIKEILREYRKIDSGNVTTYVLSPVSLSSPDPYDMIPPISKDLISDLYLSSPSNSDRSPTLNCRDLLKKELDQILNINQKIKEGVRENIKSLKKLNHNRSASMLDNEGPVCNPLQIRTKKERTYSFGGIDKRAYLYAWLSSYKLDTLFDYLVEGGYDDFDQMLNQMTSNLPITEDNLIAIGLAKSGFRRRLLVALTQEINNTTTTPRIPNKKTVSFWHCWSVTPSSNAELIPISTLKQWLESLSLQGLLNCFVNEGYEELDQLFALMHTKWAIDDRILEEMGISKPGYRHRILSRVNKDCGAVKILRKNSGGVTSRSRKEESILQRPDHAKKDCVLM